MYIPRRIRRAIKRMRGAYGLPLFANGIDDNEGSVKYAKDRIARALYQSINNRLIDRIEPINQRQRLLINGQDLRCTVLEIPNPHFNRNSHISLDLVTNYFEPEIIEAVIIEQYRKTGLPWIGNRTDGKAIIEQIVGLLLLENTPKIFDYYSDQIDISFSKNGYTYLIDEGFDHYVIEIGWAWNTAYWPIIMTLIENAFMLYSPFYLIYPEQWMDEREAFKDEEPDEYGCRPYDIPQGEFWSDPKFFRKVSKASRKYRWFKKTRHPSIDQNWLNKATDVLNELKKVDALLRKNQESEPSYNFCDASVCGIMWGFADDMLAEYIDEHWNARLSGEEIIYTGSKTITFVIENGKLVTTKQTNSFIDLKNKTRKMLYELVKEAHEQWKHWHQNSL